MRSNCLESLPDWTGDCFFLQKLNASQNFLTSLPPTWVDKTISFYSWSHLKCIEAAWQFSSLAKVHSLHFPTKCHRCLVSFLRNLGILSCRHLSFTHAMILYVFISPLAANRVGSLVFYSVRMSVLPPIRSVVLNVGVARNWEFVGADWGLSGRKSRQKSESGDEVLGEGAAPSVNPLPTS